MVTVKRHVPTFNLQLCMETMYNVHVHNATHGILFKDSIIDFKNLLQKSVRAATVEAILVLTSSYDKAWSLETSYGSLL